MTLAVDFTTEAIKDLSDIASYTAKAWGHKQARVGAISNA